MSDLSAITQFEPEIITVGSEECLTTRGLFGGSSAAGLVLTNTWGQANTAQFIPFRLSSPLIVQNMRWVNGATVGTNSVDVGIYTKEGVQLAHTGNTLTSGASSTQTVALSVTLQRGTYYMAMVVNGTTDTFGQYTMQSNNYCQLLGVIAVTSSSPLPATPTLVYGTWNMSWLPLLTLTGNAL